MTAMPRARKRPIRALVAKPGLDGHDRGAKVVAAVCERRARPEQGGGPDKIRRGHDQGKLTARERVAKRLDKNGAWFELGLFVAYDQYDGQAPGAGVITGVGKVAG